MAHKWKNYGIPYQGSKNRIIKWLANNLPRSPHGTFVDLFCGGCSVTHFMITQGSFAHYIINDINPMMPRTFLDAISGKFHDERRWISRDDFQHLRLTDAYAASCFSFGNNYKDYMYSPALEPYKRACHYAIVFNDWAQFRELCPEVHRQCHLSLDSITPLPWRHLHEPDVIIPMMIVTARRKLLGATVVSELKRIGDASLISNNPLYNSCHRLSASKLCSPEQHSGSSLECLERLERIQSLECLECLERLERLQSLECLERLQSLEYLSSLPSLQVYSEDYQDVPIPDGAVVYCDIPYAGTKNYDLTAKAASFSHDRFYKWALSRSFPVFVSEYHMPEGFTPIAAFRTRTCMASKTSTKSTERLYVQDRFAARYQRDLFGGWL
jgi:site-specific DNA-adenine methylase